MLGPLEGTNLNHWICFRLGEGRETPTLLGPLEGTNLNHWICFRLQVREGNTYSVGSLRKS
jgi:hypothetical protein